MARRSQPYRLRWPLTAFQVENIDEMFQLLFDDTLNGSIGVSASQVKTGTLLATRGGTGFSEYAVGDLLYADTTTTLARLADVATGKALISGGVGAIPSWGLIVLTTHVSGVLPTANGGTNASTWTAGSVVYAASSSALGQDNALFYWDDANAFLGIGRNSFTFGQLHVQAPSGNGNIRLSGANQAVNYIDVFQVNTTSAGLNSVGAPLLMLTDGTERARFTSVGLTLVTPLSAPNGGTGFASYAVGDLLYASTTTALAKRAAVAAGSYLRSAGVSTAPVWSTITIPNATATGDLWQGTATSTMSALASVAAGSYLRSGGVTTASVWSTLKLPNASSQGDLFYTTSANTMTVLAKDTNATRYLSNTGASNDPAWAQVALATGVSGILPIANGGTGFSNTTQTYTPTLTNVANLDASGTFVAQYTRTGAVVTVSGKFTADPTVGATLTQLRVSLPVASALAAEEQVGGVAFAGAVAGEGARIYADAANDAALVEWTPASTTSQSYSFVFQYLVV